MTLHLIQKSPFSNSALKDCLAIINTNDSVLLMQDGVYACKDKAFIDLANSTASNKIYALTDDLRARGVDAIDHLQTINYTEFVELCAHSNNVISWY
ncbi:sulfurtransferase complex subunit TusB [Pseudomonas sp. HK3]|jgi:tRNA 2-thiouridine synthesizing protein B